MTENKAKHTFNNKKAISPLIATILLVVVAVALIAIVLTWGKTFTRESLDKTTDFADLKPSDSAFFLTIEPGINGRLFAKFNPPVNTIEQITIVGYSLLDIPRVPLEPPVTIKAQSRLPLDLGIVQSPFDLVLYLDDDTIITKTGVKTINRQPSKCPEGFILVPGNFLYGTTNGNSMGFCVAKYEMKADKDGDGIGDLVSDYPAMTSTYNTWYFSEDSNITLVSTPEGSPIANIIQTEAITACESIGGHLITNNEWMTLARNIELVPSNWSGGVVGDGYLPRGNSSSSSAMDGFNELSGWTKRTLTLTNGEVIWDLVGNVWEWTNDSILRKDQPDGFNDVDDSSYIGDEWFDYSKGGGIGRYITSDNLGDTTLEYKDLFLLTSNKYNANNNGVGRIYTNSNSTSTPLRVFLRGGSWNYGSDSG
ncbi:hypothetical protein M0P25_03945, partial [archaeon]|nr:hypothetical protein [archaeon]